MSSYPKPRKNADPIALGLIDYYAQKHGVDPNLAKGIADQETGYRGYDPTSVSPAGARGTMQVMKATGLRYVSPERFNTVGGQIEAGVLETKRLSDKHGGDVGKIVKGYLGGARDPYTGITSDQYTAHVQGFMGKGDDDPIAGALQEYRSKKVQPIASITTTPEQFTKLSPQEMVADLQKGNASVPEPVTHPSKPAEVTVNPWSIEAAFEREKKAGNLDKAREHAANLKSLGWEVGGMTSGDSADPYQMALEFENAKTSGDLGKAKELGSRLSSEFNWEYGGDGKNQYIKRTPQSIMATKNPYPYVKPPKGLERPVGQGTEAYTNQRIAEGEARDRRKRIAASDKRSTVQKVLEVAALTNPVTMGLGGKTAQDIGEGLMTGVGSWAGDRVAGLGQTVQDASDAIFKQANYGDKAVSTEPTIAPRRAGVGERIKDEGEKAAQSSREFAADFGQSLAAQGGNVVGEMAPDLLLSAATGQPAATFGASSGLAARGQGKSLAESILTGIINAKGMEAAAEMAPNLEYLATGKGLEKVVAPSVGKYLARSGAMGVQNVGLQAATSGEIPDTPEKAAKEIFFALGFGAFPAHDPRAAEATRAARAIADSPETHPAISGEIKRVLDSENSRPVRTAEQVRQGEGVEQRTQPTSIQDTEVLPSSRMPSQERSVGDSAAPLPEAVSATPSIPTPTEVKPVGEEPTKLQALESDWDKAFELGDRDETRRIQSLIDTEKAAEAKQAVLDRNSPVIPRDEAAIAAELGIPEGGGELSEQAKNDTKPTTSVNDEVLKTMGATTIDETTGGHKVVERPDERAGSSVEELKAELERRAKGSVEQPVKTAYEEAKANGKPLTHQAQVQAHNPDGTFTSEVKEEYAPIGTKERRLPPHLADAGLESGNNLTYTPESLADGAVKGKAIVADKGIEASMEWVKNPENNGIEWASVGYEAMAQSRELEAQTRTSDPVAADKIAERRIQFVEDFAVEATKRGQAIAGIKAIEEFAIDRAVYILTRMSKANRKRGLSIEEEARVTRTAMELKTAMDKVVELEKQLEAKKQGVMRRIKGKAAPKKTDYLSRLEEQGKVAIRALKEKMGLPYVEENEVATSPSKSSLLRGKKIKESDSLTTAIVKMGGIKLEGERGREIQERLDKQGRVGVVTFEGKPIEDVIRDLESSGYPVFTKEAKGNGVGGEALSELTDRIERELRGDKTHQVGYQEKLDADLAEEDFAEWGTPTLDFGLPKNPKERGAATIKEGGEPPLEGDAETIAQYAAGRLHKLNTADALNTELLKEFGEDIKPHLPAIRRRAVAIRQEARLAEMADSTSMRKRTILQEIQKEIGEKKAAEREIEKRTAQEASEYRKQERKQQQIDAAFERESRGADTEQDRAVLKAEKAAMKEQVDLAKKTVAARSQAETVQERRARLQDERQEKSQAKETRRLEREQQIRDRQIEANENRERLKESQREYKEASEAERKAYRAGISESRKAEKTAQAWDTPIRNEAAAARTRLANADPKAPETLDDLVAVATEKFLPKAGKSVRNIGAILPQNFYKSLRTEFPDLVTKKNQGEIYKRSYQKAQDMADAAREVARLKSADKESRKLWDTLGIDEETQVIMMKRAEALRQQQEARRQMSDEFTRVSRSRKARIAYELFALPRSLQSSIDAPLGRQGLFYSVTHPIETARYTVPATYRGYRAFKRGDFERHITDLQAHPDYKLAKEAGLDLPVVTGESERLGAAEEDFSSAWGEKLPHVRVSEQGFTLGMNTQRLQAFSRYADLGRAEGYTLENNPEFFKQAAEFVNAATGRGNMGDKLKKATAVTNLIFYSGRLQVSRVQLINNLFNPIHYIPEGKAEFLGGKRYDPVMRKIAAKETIRLAVGMALVYGTLKAAGASVTLNPNDPDFGKVRIGKTHYDVTGGNAGLVRVAYQAIATAMAAQGGEKVRRDESFGEITKKFIRSKLAPVPGAIWNVGDAKDFVGKPANFKVKLGTKQDRIDTLQQNILIKLIEPMIVDDITDAAIEDGWLGVAKTLPALSGLGVSTYQPKAKAASSSGSGYGAGYGARK